VIFSESVDSIDTISRIKSISNLNSIFEDPNFIYKIRKSMASINIPSISKGESNSSKLLKSQKSMSFFIQKNSESSEREQTPSLLKLQAIDIIL
jgi:hypothetical protein